MPSADTNGMSLETDRFISLLRHGEAVGGGRFRGRHDDPLSATGWRQILDAGTRAQTIQPGTGRIITSAARRCAEPADHLARTWGLPLDCSDAFAERRFGDWEGLAADQIPTAALRRFWTDPVGYTPPGAEPFGDFRARVIAGWQGLTAAPGQDLLIITHGGVIRVILAELLGMSDPSGLLIEVPPVCLSRIRIPPHPGLPSLIAHGA